MHVWTILFAKARQGKDQLCHLVYELLPERGEDKQGIGFSGKLHISLISSDCDKLAISARKHSCFLKMCSGYQEEWLKSHLKIYHRTLFWPGGNKRVRFQGIQRLFWIPWSLTLLFPWSCFPYLQSILFNWSTLGGVENFQCCLTGCLGFFFCNFRRYSQKGYRVGGAQLYLNKVHVNLSHIIWEFVLGQWASRRPAY